MKNFTTVFFIVVFVAVAMAQVEIPAPVSFYDFEETDGVVVIDQGSAANNGEIVGDYIARVDGGIITKPGDTGRSIEFFEENAFGELTYVLLPYKEFMNSSNYTLSIWMQYVGTPNWGYLFWADGDFWPTDLQDRHIDVWLNPSNGTGGAVDCILTRQDGEADLRVANNADETGIGVMDGDWHQVTVVLSDNIQYTIYVDGLWAAEGISETTGIIANGGDDMYLGARPDNADATTAVKMVGLLDRARIWDVALDADQVEYLFNMEGPNGGSVGVAEKPAPVFSFALSANYPNPFNPTTTISYSLDKTENVSLDVYDTLGQKICTLAGGLQNAGSYNVQWNGVDQTGRVVPSGIYVYRLTSAERSESHKMTLLK